MVQLKPLLSALGFGVVLALVASLASAQWYIGNNLDRVGVLDAGLIYSNNRTALVSGFEGPTQLLLVSSCDAGTAGVLDDDMKLTDAGNIFTVPPNCFCSDDTNSHPCDVARSVNHVTVTITSGGSDIACYLCVGR